MSVKRITLAHTMSRICTNFQPDKTKSALQVSVKPIWYFCMVFQRVCAKGVYAQVYCRLKPSLLLSEWHAESLCSITLLLYAAQTQSATLRSSKVVGSQALKWLAANHFSGLRQFTWADCSNALKRIAALYFCGCFANQSSAAIPGKPFSICLMYSFNRRTS